MKSLFWIGMAVLILGILSLVVPLPHSEEHGFRAGRVSVGIETHDERILPPLVSAGMIVAGAAMMIVQKARA